MDVKPRSSIVSTVTTMLDLFQRGFICDIFFSGTTITPEACREGKIIVLDIPTLRWNDVGRIPQALFKFVWQRSQERCDAAAKARPVFLYSDEAQQFLTQFDAPFQATARSSRVCTLYITQNLSGMYDAVGGEAGRYSIDALLGNLRLKIFCAQDDISATATWQSELIGKTKKLFFNSGTQSAPDQSFDFFQPGKHRSAGMSEQLEYTIQPWEWSSKFRTGGIEHGFQVDAVAYQGGRIWQANGKTYLPLSFNQREEC
jgi:type IV secretory pathway TraG/TraD family ATPase VirD4